MFGSFSESSLKHYQELREVATGEEVDFSEFREIYDFTRCVRPNGSVYGTKGKCRKGVETASIHSDRKVKDLEKKLNSAKQELKKAINAPRERGAIRPTEEESKRYKKAQDRVDKLNTQYQRMKWEHERDSPKTQEQIEREKAQAKRVAENVRDVQELERSKGYDPMRSRFD